MRTVYHMFKQCLIVGLGMHILQIIFFLRRKLPTSKGVILKIWFVFLDEYHIMQLCIQK
jgi:hypothetical protein